MKANYPVKGFRSICGYDAGFAAPLFADDDTGCLRKGVTADKKSGSGRYCGLNDRNGEKEQVKMIKNSIDPDWTRSLR
jgi:hypothetical protein